MSTSNNEEFSDVFYLLFMYRHSIINNFPEIKTIDMISPEENILPGIGEVIDIVNISVRGNYYDHIV